MSTQTRQRADSSTDIRVLGRVVHYLKPHNMQIIVMYLFAIINVGATITIPLIIRFGIDEGIAKQDYLKLIQAGLVLFVIIIIQFFSFRYQGKIMMKVGNKVFYALRRDLFNHIQNLSFRYFDKNRAGTIMTKLTSDVQVLEELLMSGLDTVLVDIIMIVGIITAMLLLDLRLSLILLIIIPMLTLVVFGLQSKIVSSARKIQGRLSSVNGFLNESLSGIMVSRSFAREDRNIEIFRNFNQEYFNRTKNFYPLHAYFWQSVTTLNTGAVGLVILGGGLLLKDGLVSIGIIAAFITYVTQLFQPMQKLSNMLNQLSRALASCERIFSVLDEQPDVVDRSDALDSFSLNGDVEFKSVSFSYNSDEPVLTNISFTVPAGCSAAIVGTTGSGKSTIVHLVSRFYDATAGEILIDGIDIRNVSQQKFRQQTAVVMQEPRIFSGSVMENIKFSNPQASDQDVLVITKKLGIHAMIEDFSDGYQTEMGERGANISIGQKQLLAFARAMLRNPKILILDEASAYLDTKTEGMVQTALDLLMVGRTSFVIAHRLSTIRNADKIMVIDKGVLIESGSHEQLEKKGGIYADLLASQYQENEVL